MKNNPNSVKYFDEKYGCFMNNTCPEREVDPSFVPSIFEVVMYALVVWLCV